MQLADAEEVAAAVAAAFNVGQMGLPEPIPTATLPRRGLLYLTEVDLTEIQFEAISCGAKRLGDDWLYLSYAERSAPLVAPRLPPLSPLSLEDFRLDAHDYPAYLECAPDAGLDHVLVSPRAVWGVYVDNMGIAVVAGDDDFIDAVYASLPPALDQAVQFTEDILSTNHQGLERWIAKLLEDVLGSQTAEQVLGEATG